MGIADEDIAKVRAATDLVAIVTEHLQLKKVGQRWTGLCPFHNEKSPSFSVNQQLGFYHCLAGETEVLTADGPRPIAELAGGSHRILTSRGDWVEAPFRAFGTQPLRRIELSRNGVKKVIHATGGHRWFVHRSKKHPMVEVTTDELEPGQVLTSRLPRSRIGRVRPSAFGIPRGIVFGDGTRLARGSAVSLHGDKDAQLLKWFPHSPVRTHQTESGHYYGHVVDLPAYFKDELPSLDESASYLYGWLAGYFAADGCVDTDGTVILNSAKREHLEFVRTLASCLGIGTYGIREQKRRGIDGRMSSLFVVRFMSTTLRGDFFLIDEHRRRFLDTAKKYERRRWQVVSVEPTDRVEEVFCAQVDGTHDFVLEDNILTGNCFGCQVSGDAITFVREIEGLDFVGAVERLASKAGITLTYTNANEGRDRQKRRQLVDTVGKAVEFYHQRLLTAPDAGAARAYLRDRGISGDDVRRFEIGWAPDDWDALAKALKAPPKVFTEAGLGFTNKRNRLQDTFRARILFPIYDVNNDPVGFGGRKMPGSEGPKYKNSSESAIYGKSRLLYGLNWAKEHVVRADEVVVCEGYTDVIGYAQAGVPRAVATCGTALTEEHVKTLKRFARRIVLSFDADAAGQAAADRFYEWEKKYEIDVRVAALPPGVDPGDLAVSDPEALAAAVTDAKPFLAFRVDRVLLGGDLTTVEGRARAADTALELVAAHPNPLVRDQYVVQIADACQVDPDRLRQAAERVGPAQVARPVAADEDDEMADSVELQVLRLAVHRPDLVPAWVDVELFTRPMFKAIFTALLEATTLTEAVENVDERARPTMQRLMVEEIDDSDDVRAQRLVGRLVDEAASRALRSVEQQARQTGDVQLGAVVAKLHHGLVGLRASNWGMAESEALVGLLQGADQP